VFDFLCYPNMQAMSQYKLAPCSATYVFLGYPSSHKGCRCLDIATRQIIISRHVIFDESVFLFANTSHAPSTSSFDFLLGDDMDIAPCSTM
jgi:hypothetical protein